MNREMTVSKFVQYVGTRPQKQDNVAGTGLVWTPGQIHEVPTEKAALMLQYPSVWQEHIPAPEPVATKGVHLPVSELSKPAVDAIAPWLSLSLLMKWAEEEVQGANRRTVIAALQKEISKRESA